MKSYTDLEQSRKLAEILPLKSADMYYSWIGTAYLLHAESYNEIIAWRKEYAKTHNNPSFCTSIIPCWSLAALLGVLPIIDNRSPVISKTFDEKYRVVYHSIAYEKAILTSDYNNSVDACVDMIIRLNELNLL